MPQQPKIYPSGNTALIDCSAVWEQLVNTAGINDASVQPQASNFRTLFFVDESTVISTFIRKSPAYNPYASIASDILCIDVVNCDTKNYTRYQIPGTYSQAQNWVGPKTVLYQPAVGNTPESLFVLDAVGIEGFCWCKNLGLNNTIPIAQYNNFSGNLTIAGSPGIIPNIILVDWGNRYTDNGAGAPVLVPGNIIRIGVLQAGQNNANVWAEYGGIGSPPIQSGWWKNVAPTDPPIYTPPSLSPLVDNSGFICGTPDGNPTRFLAYKNSIIANATPFPATCILPNIPTNCTPVNGINFSTIEQIISPSSTIQNYISGEYGSLPRQVTASPKLGFFCGTVVQLPTAWPGLPYNPYYVTDFGATFLNNNIAYFLNIWSQYNNGNTNPNILGNAEYSMVAVSSKYIVMLPLQTTQFYYCSSPKFVSGVTNLTRCATQQCINNARPISTTGLYSS